MQADAISGEEFKQMARSVTGLSSKKRETAQGNKSDDGASKRRRHRSRRRKKKKVTFEEPEAADGQMGQCRRFLPAAFAMLTIKWP